MFWLNAGGFTTIRKGRIPRWATDRPRRRHPASSQPLWIRPHRCNKLSTLWVQNIRQANSTPSFTGALEEWHNLLQTGVIGGMSVQTR